MGRIRGFLKLLIDVILVSDRSFLVMGFWAGFMLVIFGGVHLSGGTMHPNTLVGSLLLFLGLWVTVNAVRLERKAKKLK